GISRTLGLLARSDGLFIVSQTERSLEIQTMFLATWLLGRKSGPERTGRGRVRCRGGAQPAGRRGFTPRLQVLEDRSRPRTLAVPNNRGSGTGSIRAQILAASSGDTIVFASSLKNQTITLASELVIDKSLNIEGLGATKLTVSGNDVTRVFDISGSVT